MHADKLPITGPCPIDLDAIGFDRKSRESHCSHCVKSVHILSNMTRGEAMSFMRENKGKKLCVSYSRDEQGRIRFRPEPPPAPALVPVTRLRARPSRRAGLVATIGMGVALAACAPHGDPPPRQTETTVSDTHQTITNPPEVDPEPIPLAGAAVIPEDIVDGEMEVPDPDRVNLDEPCDAEAKTDRAEHIKPVPPPEVHARAMQGL